MATDQAFPTGDTAFAQKPDDSGTKVAQGYTNMGPNSFGIAFGLARLKQLKDEIDAMPNQGTDAARQRRYEMDQRRQKILKLLDE